MNKSLFLMHLQMRPFSLKPEPAVDYVRNTARKRSSLGEQQPTPVGGFVVRWLAFQTDPGYFSKSIFQLLGNTGKRVSEVGVDGFDTRSYDSEICVELFDDINDTVLSSKEIPYLTTATAPYPAAEYNLQWYEEFSDILRSELRNHLKDSNITPEQVINRLNNQITK